MTDKHPKRPGDLKGPLWGLRHNTAQMACATSPLDVPPPTSASWLNAVEGFFARLTRRRLKRGVFGSLVDLQALSIAFLKIGVKKIAKALKRTLGATGVKAAKLGVSLDTRG